MRGSQLICLSLVTRHRGQWHSMCVKPSATNSSMVACSGLIHRSTHEGNGEAVRDIASKLSSNAPIAHKPLFTSSTLLSAPTDWNLAA
jgi:hypothetical protein